MNQMIKKSEAITYTIIALALLIFLAIWPFGLIQQKYVSKSDEKVAMQSEAVNVEHNLTQMFVAENDNLSAVDLYICNDMQGETITFRLYDASYTEIYNIFYVVKQGEKLPGFVRIPVDYELIKDQEYYYTIEGLSNDLYVNLEDTYESTSIVNGILAYAGEELQGYNVIIRYEYSSPFVWWQTILLAACLLGGAALLSYLVKLLFIKKCKDSEIKVQTVFQIIFNPVIALFTAISLYCVFPGRKFGTGAVNYAFYGIAILMLAVFLLYEVNYRRTSKKPLMTLSILKDRIPDYLQAVSFALVLWYCFEYMNGLYDIHHAYATCRILIWFMIALIVTYRKKELLNWPNLIWLTAGSIFAYFYAKPYAGIEEQGELYQLRAYVIVVLGFVVLNMVLTCIDFIRKKQKLRRINSLFASLFVVFVLSLFVFRNTREWPIFIILLCVLLYFRMAFWENSDRLIGNLCNGICLNFAAMIVFSLCHRPYHYYIYYRYAMTYHTVTMTAVHLTLVLAALSVKVFAAQKKGASIKEMLAPLGLFGVGCSYLLFTLSRTGFLATGLMVFVLLLILAYVYDKKGKRIHLFITRTALLFVSVVAAFPITFTLTRAIPSLTNDPVTYEVESKELSIQKGVASDSDSYIDISRFMAVFGSKVLGVGEDVTSKNDIFIPNIDEILLASVEDNIYAYTKEPLYVASAQDVYENGEEEIKKDITNGRMDIYREYIKHWNLTGHEEMGIDFEDGTNSVHAHNIFLQAIHDHGLIVGIYFILFMLFAVIYSIRYVKKQKEKDGYSILIPSLLIGFMAAGLTEWIFHPCNPFCMAVLIAMAPLFYGTNRAEKEQIDEKEQIN